MRLVVSTHTHTHTIIKNKDNGKLDERESRLDICKEK